MRLFGLSRFPGVISVVACLGACSSEPSSPPATETVASTLRSELSSSATSLPADGISTAVLTVRLRDSTGAALTKSAGIVTLHATAGALSPVRDNGDGTYTATDTAATVVGADTVTAALDGIGLARSVSISFVGLPPASGEWVDPYTWLYGDGVAQEQVTMLVRDQHGNPVLGADVTFATSAGTISGQGNDNGYYYATLTSSPRDEIAVVTALYKGEAFGSRLSVRFDTNRHWGAKASLPSPRMNMGVVEAGGRVFSVGGTNWGPGSWVGNLDMYDPASDSWSAEPAMPTARTDLGAGVVGGIIYAVGGYNATDLSVVEAYDLSTRTWSARSPMPIARSGFAIGVANGILYAVGGRVKGSGAGYSRASLARDRGTREPASSRIAMDIVGSGNALGILEGYDPSTDRWTELPPMPTPRSHLGVGVLNGIVYAVGGSDGTTTFATVEAFDPATGRWTTVAPLHEPRALLSVAVLGGKLYAIGGIPVYIGSPVVEVYDPLFDTWASAPLMLTGRMSAGSVTLNGLIYTVAGACDYTALASVEAYTP